MIAAIGLNGQQSFQGGLLGASINASDLFTNDLIDPKIVAEVSATLK